MQKILCNDKFLITVAVTVLGESAFIWSYLTNVSAENIITAIVSGLFGMGTGLALAHRTQNERAEDKED